MSTVDLNTCSFFNYNMTDTPLLRVGILDYTPLIYDDRKIYDKPYDPKLAEKVLKATLRESDRDIFFSPFYIRALAEKIPDQEFDLFVIAGSILSTMYPSAELNKAKEQVESFITKTPTLGICFGLHLINLVAGGKSVPIATKSSKPEDKLNVGPAKIRIYEDIDYFARAGDILTVPLNQMYKIQNEGRLRPLAIGEGTSGVQIADGTDYFDGNPVMGVQFHPEFAATDEGWRAYKNVYELTILRVLRKDEREYTLDPFLKILDKRVLRRLKRASFDPNYMIGREIEKEDMDLLMSPFHDIDFRKKLIGRASSEDIHTDARKNCRAIISHFARRAAKAKQERESRVKPTVKKAAQLELKLTV